MSTEENLREIERKLRKQRLEKITERRKDTQREADKKLSQSLTRDEFLALPDAPLMKEPPRIHVISRPPYKQLPADASERKNQASYKNQLVRESKKVLSKPLKGHVSLRITYARRVGRADAANIVGGIADALQHIA